MTCRRASNSCSRSFLLEPSGTAFPIYKCVFDVLTFDVQKLTQGPHYSKSQIFVQKFNFDKTPTFWRVFHPNFFWQFFSWNQSCQQLKSPKPQHFHEFFTQNNSTIFSGNQSWIFGQKMKILNSVKIRLTMPFFLSRDILLRCLQLCSHSCNKIWNNLISFVISMLDLSISTTSM